LQQSMRFVQMLDTAKVPPARMIAGDCEILKRSRHSEPYLTKSEVRLRPPKIARRLDKQGLRRVPASPEYAGSRCQEIAQLQQLKKFVKEVNATEVRQTPMIKRDSKISRRPAHPEPYLTKS
jgi:hypothetical protein